MANNNQNLKDRFENKIYYGIDGCWWWISTLNNLKYGLIRVNGYYEKAYRVSYELYKGPIPEHLEVRHICDNRTCVNPNHLVLGTHADNMRDMRGKHDYTNRSGFNHVRCKVTPEIVDIILKEKPNKKNHELALRFGLCDSSISRIFYKYSKNKNNAN